MFPDGNKGVIDIVLQETREVIYLESDNLDMKLKTKLSLAEVVKGAEPEKPSNIIVHNIRGMKKLARQKPINHCHR